MLWNPEDRLTAAQCLELPYFSSVVQKRGHGQLFIGPHPRLEFEDWNNKTLEFWTGEPG